MIRTAIDRARPTRSSLAASTGLHALLLLLLIWQVGRQTGLIDDSRELTEIAYIEAHYGEDIAAKVKLKSLERRGLLQEPGRGVATRSAIKPELPDPEPPRPETRPQVAEVAAPKPAPSQAPAPLPAAERLTSRAQQESHPIVDETALRHASSQVAAEAASVSATTVDAADTFVPQGGGLQSRGSRIVIVDGPVAPRHSGRSLVAGTGAASKLAGGGLQPAAARYQGAASLLPAEKGGSGGGGRAVLDVAGPASAGGSEQRGRRTVLDYGSGGGSGALAGRSVRRVEGVDSRAIADEAAQDKTTGEPEVAEVDQAAAQGVSMTISGQIEGRKILHSVAPEYPAEARRQGWEGVVAIHFTVLADGRVKDNMYFEQSSVHRPLNRAGLEAVQQFLFAPLPAEKAAVEQWGVITIVFRLR
jgi:TonB family protein